MKKEEEVEREKREKAKKRKEGNGEETSHFEKMNGTKGTTYLPS